MTAVREVSSGDHEWWLDRFRYFSFYQSLTKTSLWFQVGQFGVLIHLQNFHWLKDLFVKSGCFQGDFVAVFCALFSFNCLKLLSLKNFKNHFSLLILHFPKMKHCLANTDVSVMISFSFGSVDQNRITDGGFVSACCAGGRRGHPGLWLW